jgi:hypothetical protein
MLAKLHTYAEPELEAEPLHFEEEEEVAGGTLDGRADGMEGTPAATAAAAPPDPSQAEDVKGHQKAKKKKTKQRERLAGGGFVEAEAELSDEEGVDLDDEDDEEEGADGNLVRKGKFFLIQCLLGS